MHPTKMYYYYNHITEIPSFVAIFNCNWLHKHALLLMGNMFVEAEIQRIMCWFLLFYFGKVVVFFTERVEGTNIR